jgi:TPR repeat protein
VDGYEHAYYWVAVGYKTGISIDSASDGNDNKKNDRHQVDGGMMTTPTTLMVVQQPDLMQAMGYFEKAATLNNDQEAQMEMAKLCSNGFKYTTHTGGGLLTKTYKDRTGALKWYEMAAAQHGNALAHYCAGIYYAKGLAPLETKNVDKAMAYYTASAKQGYTLAMVQLAQLIIQEASSIHTDDDDDALDKTHAQYKVAFDWLTTAAEKQDPAAFRELAHMYEKGLYPHHALSETVRYQQGFTLLGHPLLLKDPQAWCAKSRYYEHGWFVDQDLDRSVYCLEQSVKFNYVK